MDSDDEGLDEGKEKLKHRLVNKDDDFSSKFGRQLKSKDTGAAAESFFFYEEDERLQESLDFFFGERQDLEQIRAEYQEKRPILSAILKKKARSRAKLTETKKRKMTHNKVATSRSARRPSAKHKARNFNKKRT